LDPFSWSFWNVWKAPQAGGDPEGVKKGRPDGMNLNDGSSSFLHSSTCGFVAVAYLCKDRERTIQKRKKERGKVGSNSNVGE